MIQHTKFESLKTLVIQNPLAPRESKETLASYLSNLSVVFFPADDAIHHYQLLNDPNASVIPYTESASKTFPMMNVFIFPILGCNGVLFEWDWPGRNCCPSEILDEKCAGLCLETWEGGQSNDPGIPQDRSELFPWLVQIQGFLVGCYVARATQGQALLVLNIWFMDWKIV